MKTQIISYFKKVSLIVVLLLISYALVSGYVYANDKNLIVSISYKSATDDIFQLFYLLKDVEDEFNESNSIRMDLKSSNTFEEVSFSLPLDTEKIRIDFGSKASTINIEKIEIKRLFGKYTVKAQDIIEDASFNDFIQNKHLENDILCFDTIDGDPFIILNSDISGYVGKIHNHTSYNVAAISALVTILVYFAMKIIKFAFDIQLFRHIGVFIEDIYGSRTLIFKLAVSDFKTKYAGSYFGILWAFVQPIITILVFWFVFQVGFRSGSVEKVPFVLWLMSGLIPWFFFSEAWMSATNCFFEYSYLVKKVLFKISILPLVKILSSWFVHIFFIGAMLLTYAAYGIYPTLFTLQLLYYLFCLMFLIIALSFISSSIVIFFKDLGQMIGIVLQFGMWLTPIMWTYRTLPEGLRWIFKINPMYYIVEGYRDSMFNQVWFWQKSNESIWFWVLTLIYFLLGFIVFKKLKPHFSDVL